MEYRILREVMELKQGQAKLARDVALLQERQAAILRNQEDTLRLLRLLREDLTAVRQQVEPPKLDKLDSAQRPGLKKAGAKKAGPAVT